MNIDTIKDFYDFLHDHTDTEKTKYIVATETQRGKQFLQLEELKIKIVKSIKEDEILLLKVFKNRAYPFIKHYLDNDIELLTIGQHQGLPIRVLDWTKNPMYFAVEESFSNEDERGY